MSVRHRNSSYWATETAVQPVTEESGEWEDGLTGGRDVGEALTLAPFPLAVADVEVHVDGSGESLVPVGRDFNDKRILQHGKVLSG